MKKKVIAIIVVLVVLALVVTAFVWMKFGNKADVDETVKIKEDTTSEKNVPEESKEDEELYFKVLNNEVKFVNEDNKELFFKEYMQVYKESTENPKIKYTVFDFDGDSKDEMIVRIEVFSDGFYLILNNEDATVYGFEEVYRGLKDLKTDGTYMASGGASSNGVLRDEFEKNKRIQVTLAEMDMGKFQIDGKDVSEKEYQEYVDEFNKKENVEFTNYIDKYEFEENGLADESSDASTETPKETSSSENKTTEKVVSQTSSFQEGTYIMTVPSLVGTEAEGYDTTVVFKNGQVSFLESCWQVKKSGTYSVQGDILTIKYTSGNDVDSIEGDKGIISLNETEEYKIDGNRIVLQRIVDNPYATAGSIVYELNK